MRNISSHVFAAAILLAMTLANGQTTQPATRPATQPKATVAAQPILKEVRDAYANIKSLDLAGTLTVEIDAGGQRGTHTEPFTGSFQAPARFKHEMPDDLLIVSNGTKAYAYKADQKRYASLDAPAERIGGESDLASTIWQALAQQNPSLLLALSKDAQATLESLAESNIDRGEDVTLDGSKFSALTFTDDSQPVRVLIDPRTHLVRQYSVDLKPMFIARGVPDVKVAQMTVDYTRSQPGVQVADAGFGFTPPSEAMLVRIADEAQPAGASGDVEGGTALTGKPAPAFSLKDLDGNPVSLQKLQGSVVVLDFWATWCGPCIMSMPHIDELNKELAPKGLKLYAVNFNEQAGVVKQFLTTKSFSMPVLLDSDGKVSALYKAPPIPQTFIIGKDGKVRKVFVGYGPGVEKTIREAVDAAMRE
ncbi:MAG TPA: redoxin domain-containing protein [Tepidisphaeraceae bacterium]|jgi:thiol-disulfide isomerase/thioredoxin/outer membrane lipoprotein-sorting protein